jgi:hypothetical protein
LCEFEGGVREAAIDGAAIRRLGTAHIATMREEQAEIVRSGSVAMLILVREPLFGLGKLVRIDEALAEVECDFGGSGRRCRYGISQGLRRSCKDQPYLRA